MAEIYTAQEMRHAADLREAWGDKDEVNEMLRQAADALEREEKREKKYEYAEKLFSGKILSLRRGTPKEMKAVRLFPDSSIVRHEVGEWEEVKDGE